MRIATTCVEWDWTCVVRCDLCLVQVNEYLRMQHITGFGEDALCILDVLNYVTSVPSCERLAGKNVAEMTCVVLSPQVYTGGGKL